MLYSTPDCVVKTIVPVGTAHVGCTVTLADGVLGGVQLAQPETVKTIADQQSADRCLYRMWFL